MITTAWCSQADLEIALGGPSVLVQLSDRNGSGVANAAVVADYLGSGANYIASKIQIRHSAEALADLDDGAVQLLRDWNKWWSAGVAWDEGAQGQAMPPSLAKMVDRVEAQLEAVRTGKAVLGRSAGSKQAALSQFVGVVDHDPGGHRVSIAGLKSSGFR